MYTHANMTFYTYMYYTTTGSPREEGKSEVDCSSTSSITPIPADLLLGKKWSVSFSSVKAERPFFSIAPCI